MDVRIDPRTVLGLELGDAHVLRNAGGRVTEDVLRSLALSSHALGVDRVMIMQHTRCGLSGMSDGELRELTGADLDFLPIEDHAADLLHDIETLAATPYLATLREISGWLFDVDTGAVEAIHRWERPQ